jgi:hypothetical protein
METKRRVLFQEDEDVKDWTNKLGTADFGIREDDVGNQDPEANEELFQILGNGR